MDGLQEVTEGKNGLSPVDRDALNNFFWSFHHAQGNPTLQTLVTIYTARKYDKDKIGSPEALEQRVLPHISKLHVPKEHMSEEYDEEDGMVNVLDDKAAQDNDAGFQVQWGRLKLILDRVFYGKPDRADINWMGGYDGDVYKANALSSDEFMFKIVSHVIDEDLNFQVRDRQGRKEGSDTHSSHLQMYISEEATAQSPEYAALYQDINTFLQRLSDGEITPDTRRLTDNFKITSREIASLKERFAMLKSKWEANHPGKTFLEIDPTKLSTFDIEGHTLPVSFVETLQVIDGVECDVYKIVEDDSKDLGIIRIDAGKHTSLQEVLKGEKTVEGYLSGKGKLVITKSDGTQEEHSVDDYTTKPFEVTVSIGETMQWIADNNSPLIAYEICYPPYEDGRYQNL